MGLSESLTSEAIKNVTKELLSKLDAAVETAKKEYDEAVKVRDTIKNALQPAKALASQYFLPSRTRTDGPGHFVSLYGDNTTSCTCETSRFGRQCWAQKWVVSPFNSLRRADYSITSNIFNSKIKPYRYGVTSRPPANNGNY